jgi:hypothetical protein
MLSDLVASIDAVRQCGNLSSALSCSCSITTRRGLHIKGSVSRTN